MAGLIKYFQYITFPDGNPAPGRSQEITLLGGNVMVPLFSDKAGTLPLANPITTAADGRAEFYAAAGSFISSLANELFHYEVDPTEPDDAWPHAYAHVQAVASATWTVDHHFGVFPAVTILQSGNVVEADIFHPTDEQTVITFSSPQTGVALLRR